MWSIMSIQCIQVFFAMSLSHYRVTWYSFQKIQNDRLFLQQETCSLGVVVVSIKIFCIHSHDTFQFADDWEW